jgi:iron complex transport system permease protein
MLLGLLPLALLRWRVNLLALPDDEARAMGVDAPRLRLWVIAAATLATSAAVAIAGVIGWIGLVVPHAARMLAGPGFARVLPLSALLGAGFLLLVDTVCRIAFAGELPPGVVTAIVGTPAFIALLAASSRRTP